MVFMEEFLQGLIAVAPEDSSRNENAHQQPRKLSTDCFSAYFLLTGLVRIPWAFHSLPPFIVPHCLAVSLSTAIYNRN